jgi:hypothetical protein
VVIESISTLSRCLHFPNLQVINNGKFGQPPHIKRDNAQQMFRDHCIHEQAWLEKDLLAKMESKYVETTWFCILLLVLGTRANSHEHDFGLKNTLCLLKLVFLGHHMTSC